MRESKEFLQNDIRSERSGLDRIDALIVKELSADARIPRAELSLRVSLSAPSVADRVRRLEDPGVITGIDARIIPAKLGYGLTVLIRARSRPRCCREERRYRLVRAFRRDEHLDHTVVICRRTLRAPLDSLCAIKLGQMVATDTLRCPHPIVFRTSMRPARPLPQPCPEQGTILRSDRSGRTRLCPAGGPSRWPCSRNQRPS